MCAKPGGFDVGVPSAPAPALAPCSGGVYSAMSVAPVATLTDDVAAALARLIPQLSGAAPVPDRAALERIVASPGAVLFVARDPGDAHRIVGTLTLVLYRIPTGVRARIEDVVVDAPARGRGFGTALVEAALDRARTAGARTADLTSHPRRRAANRLYLRLGFQRRKTNVYRYRLGN